MGAGLLRLFREELLLLRSEGTGEITVSDKTLEDLSRVLGPATPGGNPAATVPPAPRKAKAAPAPAPEPKETPAPAKPSPFPPPPEVALPDGSKQERWEHLRKSVLACPTCLGNLNPGKKVVFGVGSLDARIFFCGEAPGADEETEGEPFVGPAGKLLNSMIAAMGLKREDVYIGNIMNWRPKTGNSFGNRPPTDEEAAFCLPYLRTQIAIVQPEVIVALGGTAAKGLLGIETKGKMARLRGQWREFESVPLVITYHPSYLLNHDSVASKRKVWEDLLSVMDRLEMPVSEKQRNYFLAALG